jgi:S-formylglutathione hydrolase FrmB
MLGRLEVREIEAPALRDNPLGDPSRRTVLVYLPPGGGAGRPAAYFLHGFTGSALGWTNVSAFQPTVPERLDGLVASGSIPPLVGVFPDGFTALGGTQWTNAPAVGRYQDHVAEDVVAFVDGTFGTDPHPASRAIVGRSSGGYGALAMGRDRPDVFGHLGCHAADACFEYCFLPDLPRAAAALLGSGPAEWLESMKARARETKLSGSDHPPLNVLAMAAHFSPNPEAPLGLDLPFDPETARIREEVWARWLEHDPVRFVPRRIDAFRRLRSVFLDCGTRDEFALRWGTRMVAESLRSGGVEVRHEEFEDGHQGTGYRFDASLRWLAPRLGRG